MTKLELRFDLRAPAWGAPRGRLYRACLDMGTWADRLGFDLLRVSEHHGAEDGYCPSPVVVAAALAGCTSHARIRCNALILPLHEPLRVAEDLAVADLVSGGRMEVLVGAGYRRAEFSMFGVDPARRGSLVEEGVAVLRQAWKGEPFPYRGRTVQVLPRPLQDPHPPIHLGGSSPAAARRAARLDLPFVPTDPALHALYRQERHRLGLADVPPLSPTGPPFVFVADDPEQAWARLLPHLLHESNSYAAWAHDGGTPLPYRQLDTARLRDDDGYQVLTPDECIDLARSLEPDGTFLLHPLPGGLDPDVAWSSLELFASRVLPALRPGP